MNNHYNRKISAKTRVGFLFSFLPDRNGLAGCKMGRLWEVWECVYVNQLYIELLSSSVPTYSFVVVRPCQANLFDLCVTLGFLLHQMLILIALLYSTHGEKAEITHNLIYIEKEKQDEREKQKKKEVAGA